MEEDELRTGEEKKKKGGCVVLSSVVESRGLGGLTGEESGESDADHFRGWRCCFEKKVVSKKKKNL